MGIVTSVMHILTRGEGEKGSILVPKYIALV